MQLIVVVNKIGSYVITLHVYMCLTVRQLFQMRNRTLSNHTKYLLPACHLTFINEHNYSSMLLWKPGTKI